MTGPVEGGVYDIWQAPPDNVHELAVLNVPDAVPSLHDTEPVGVVCVPLSVSATVAVYVIVSPILAENILGVTVVLVVLGHGWITAALPEMVPTTVPPHTLPTVPELVNVIPLLVMMPKLLIALLGLLVIVPPALLLILDPAPL